ncbi:MAG TPA: pyridoxamine 5'-phosphate oxidase family protein [Corynebacterium sp.]|nr:pyridoxamine 5'-phosphate oxidase family protein [Corynebacterium sp.]
MNTDDDYMEILSAEESLELMSTVTLGRLVVRRKDDIDLFPLNYAVDEGKIYFRTAEGTKLFSLALGNEVLFEADHAELDDALAWSVIIKGQARILTSHAEILAAEELPVKPWTPSLKYNFVEITPKEISGRRFQLGEEPERY